MPKPHKHHPIKRLGRKAPFAVRAHHAKPLRKRHVLALALSMVAIVVVAANGVSYLYSQYDAEVSASLSSRQELFARNETERIVTLRSSYGFGLKVDKDLFDLTATADIAGELQKFDTYNVVAERAYTAVEVRPRPGSTVANELAGSQLTVVGSPDKIVLQDQAGRQRLLLDEQINSDKVVYNPKLISEATRALAGTTFVHRSYDYSPKPQPKSIFRPQSIKVQVLVGFLPNNSPLIIKLTTPANTTQIAAYDQVIGSIFSDTGADAPVASATKADVAMSPGLTGIFNRLGLTPLASARAVQLDNARIVATNIPAVVKLYHVRCGSIHYNGQAITDDTCSAMTGTGFFVSSDGLIATNGHVVAGDAKETLASGLTPAILARLLQADGYTSRDISAITTDFVDDAQSRAGIVQAVQQLPADAITYQGLKDFYIAALATDVPDLERIVKTRDFNESLTIKRAELKAMDYSAEDLNSKSGFSHSDIAVLKISGSNYPVVRLGSIDALVQGANVTVVGYPNDAESNGLVRNDTLQTSATEGIVSAIRRVNGNNGKVVQSDVAIGHGNSGGPAFDQSGQVFGIATYLLGGTDGGSGISYLRDVQDLKNVLSANNLRLDTSSQTQQLWEEGLDAFYAARYGKAVDKFKAAQKAYGPHVLAAQYTDIANQKIANGEEAQSPVLGWLIAGGLITGLFAFVYTVVLIVRHRAHHHMYLALQAGYLAGPFSGLFSGPRPAAVPIDSHHPDVRSRE